jgi:hypothetical protein
MQKVLQWEAFSKADRTAIIDTVKSTISQNHGYIVNFNMFSDLALTLSVEIEEQHIPKLHLALSSVVDLSSLNANSINSSSGKEWLVAINISFSQGKGNMKQSIPKVPG